MVTLEPKSSNREIEKPDENHRSEFEVQAFLYSRLLQMGVDARGELVMRFKLPSGKFEQHRFDIVIFEGTKAVRIVEVKSAPIKHKNGLENTRQARRYTQFGIPVTFIYGMADANRFLAAYLGLAVFD